MKNDEDEQRATGNKDSKRFQIIIIVALLPLLLIVYLRYMQIVDCRCMFVWLVSSVREYRKISRDDFIDTFNNFDEIFIFWGFFFYFFLFINESVSRFHFIYFIIANKILTDDTISNGIKRFLIHSFLFSVKQSNHFSSLWSRLAVMADQDGLLPKQNKKKMTNLSQNRI